MAERATMIARAHGASRLSTRHSTFGAGAVLAIVIAFAASGCARAADRPPSDTLVIALEAGPLHLDPRVGTDQASWRVHDVVYNGVMRKGEGGEFLPDLAESCTTEDAKTWKVRLRDGVRFHDGRTLTAED